MNYIKRLEQENRELRGIIAHLGQHVIDQLVYFSSPKFQGVENDYAHVSTDVVPKLVALRAIIAETPGLYRGVHRAVEQPGTGGLLVKAGSVL